MTLLVQVGPEKARLALSLVEYHSELEAAMEYVFGATFICETLSDAKQVICYIAETAWPLQPAQSCCHAFAPA